MLHPSLLDCAVWPRLCAWAGALGSADGRPANDITTAPCMSDAACMYVYMWERGCAILQKNDWTELSQMQMQVRAFTAADLGLFVRGRRRGEVRYQRWLCGLDAACVGRGVVFNPLSRTGGLWCCCRCRCGSCRVLSAYLFELSGMY